MVSVLPDRGLLSGLGRHRALIQSLLDTAAWGAALALAIVLRYEVIGAWPRFSGLVVLVPVAVLTQAFAGVAFGIYTGRSRFGSFDEVTALAKAALVTTALVASVNAVVAPRPVPMSVPLIAGLAAMLIMGGVRYTWRLAMERRRRPSGDDLRRLLVFGAGEGGAQMVPQLLKDPTSKFLPVGLIDDDPSKRNLRIMGVPVMGGRSQLAEIAATTGADTLLIAVPSAGADLVTEMTELGLQAGLEVKVLPPVRELFEGRVEVDDIRDVTTADLLGRHEIETDVKAIAGYLSGQRVLVTGAGGSIGSELCRQIYRFAPERLIMLDRDESALHAVQLSIDGRALLDSPDLVLLDIRDNDALRAAMQFHQPHVVFHAAALKHLVLLERNPAEAVKTNIVGTLNLLDLSAESGVRRFVNISTDKAADPCSVLGYSKRITERLTSHFSATTGAPYLSVRFGNVLGSRGSVLTTFQAQVDRGGPITVTHRDVTRFFMTVEEAVQLVIQAGAIGGAGEALVLDMGKAVSIAEVARLVSARSPRRITVEFTGLRPGEKLHERLLASSEVDSRPTHPLISQVAVPPLDPTEAVALEGRHGRAALIAGMASLSTNGSVGTTDSARQLNLLVQGDKGRS